MCLAKLPYGKYFLLFLGLAPLLSSTLTTYPWHCLLPGTIGRSNLILAYALGLLSFRELPVLGEKAGVAMGSLLRGCSLQRWRLSFHLEQRSAGWEILAMYKRVRGKIQEKRGSSMGSSFEYKCLALPSD